MARTQCDVILSFFDSIKHAAEVTKTELRTWYNWQKSGLINQKDHLQILTSARSAGIMISPGDFCTHLMEQLIESESAHKNSAAVAEPVG